jgi:hypothetical protein
MTVFAFQRNAVLPERKMQLPLAATGSEAQGGQRNKSRVLERLYAGCRPCALRRERLPAHRHGPKRYDAAGRVERRSWRLGQSCRKAGDASGQAGAANLAFIPPEIVPQFVEVGEPHLVQKPLSLVMGGLS